MQQAMAVICGHSAAQLRWRFEARLTLFLPARRLSGIPSEARMKNSRPLLCLAAALFCSSPMAAQDQLPTYAEQRMAARRELELAKFEFRNYWQMDYPRIRRHLDAQIQLTEAEIRNYKERLRQYRPFDRFSTGSPFTITLQELRMCVLDAELRLRDLFAERSNLVRFRTAEWRDLELRVHEARLRVAEIEAAAEEAENAL
jgi:hypothetical protein